MPDDGLSLLGLGGLEYESHPHVLGAGAAKPELIGQVAAQREALLFVARALCSDLADEEKRLAILDWLSELPVCAREKWWAPRFELIWFEATRQQHRVPPIPTQLAFELARTDRRHGAERAQAEQVEALSLLRVEGQLARGKRSQELARVGDAQEPAWSRSRRCETGRERTRRKAESGFAADRLQQPMPRGADRLTGIHHTSQVEPRDAFISYLDYGREVVERGRDQLADANHSLFVRQDEGGLRTQVFRLAQCHGRENPKGLRLIRRRDDVLVPSTDDDRCPVKVRPPRELEMGDQTAADAHVSISAAWIGASL